MNAGMTRTERMAGIKQDTHREDDRNQAGYTETERMTGIRQGTQSEDGRN